MAQYYNFVAGTSVPIMVEDVQQICDGQSIQLVVEDINNCANGTPQFVTYAAAPQHPEAGLFHQPTILGGNQLPGVPLDQRQNVYIIKTTNDLPVQQNALKPDVIHTSLANDGLVNLVDERGSKLLANNIHEVQQQQPQQQQQQIQWLMPENNINYEASMKPAQKMTPTVKTPQQRTTQSLTLQTPGQCPSPSGSEQYNVPGPSDKKPARHYKGKLRGGVTGGGPGRSSLGPTGDAITPVKKLTVPRRKISPKPQQQQQQSQQLQTALTNPVARPPNTNLTNNSRTPNNGGNNLGATYRAKTFGTPIPNTMPQNPATRQQFPTSSTRPAILKTSDAAGQARNTSVASQALKSLPPVHVPAMNALSERIKQDQMKKVLNIIGAIPPPANSGVSSPLVASPRAPLHSVLPRQQTPQNQRVNQQNPPAQRTPVLIGNNEKNNQKQQTQMAIQRQQMQIQQDSRQMVDIIKKQTSMLCQQKYQREQPVLTTSDNDERMEVDSGTSECGMDVADMNNVNQDCQDDKAAESIAYLQKTIDNPQTTVVQDQISGHTVKMLVVLQNGEQRLITFDIPNEPCTVLDLLEQANISFCEETSVSLVSDRTLGINYIVEGGSHMVNCPDIPDPSETYQTQENTLPDSSSPNFGASDENSNSSVTQNEEPKYIEGKVAVCPNCGISSLDFNRCSRCKKRLPDNVKAMPMVPDSSQAKEAMISIDSFYKKSNEQNSMSKVSSDPPTGNKRPSKGGRRPAAKKRPVKEPECLIISSDEEEDGSGKRRKSESTVSNVSSLTGSSAGAVNDEPDTIHEKEPIITNSTSSAASEQSVEPESGGIKGGGREEQNMEDGSVDKPQTALQCRTVRIGSYKYVPREPIVISQSGVRFAVPLLEDETSFVNIDVKFKDIVNVLIHFGKSMPVLFFYTSTATGAMIREVLGMQDTKGPYYDPAGKDHTHKRITLLPEIISEDSKIILKNLFMPNEVLVELNPKEANDILIRASPKESQTVGTRRQGQTTAVNSNANGGEIQVMTVYPPPPAKGGIAINTEDYICLGVDQFLNDAIIDFYLRYLTLEVLSENDHNRTHVFSSYFYKRLTSPHAQVGESSATLTAAARRHARVQKWTKNVNIFEKDFIIIPINEHAHWFLAIICYPGLVGKVALPLPPAKDKSVAKTVQKSKKLKEMKLQAVTIGSTTITPVATTITIDQMDEGSERDEAEGDDEEMEMDSDDDEDAEEPSPSFSPLTPDMEERSMVKLPCILIFDSLAGASRSRVVATLRDYLSCEHLAKVGTEKTFSKDTIKGSSPKVPQQSNFTDCGLYLLQYVESFFKDPIRNYTLPIKTLKLWFQEIVVTRKREELAKLLVKLMNQTKGDKTILLPIVQFPTQAGKLKPKPETPAEPKTPKVEADAKKKLIQQQTPQTPPTVEDKTRLVALSTSNVLTTSENSNEKEVATRTTYQIVLPGNISSPDNNSPESIFDAKPRSSSGTLSYLRNKRIPRLMREHESQETQQGAGANTRKQKGDSDSITKSLNNSSSSSGSSIVSLAKSVTATNYDSCK